LRNKNRAARRNRRLWIWSVIEAGEVFEKSRIKA